MDDQQKKFALLAYEKSIDTYNEIANRVSTRFNIILTIDVALAGFFVNAWINDKINSDNGAYLLPFLGLLISVFLYFQSAQDKYIIKKEMQRVNRIKDRIILELGLPTFPCLFIPLDESDSVGNENPKKRFIGDNLFSWRSSLFSVTKIPIWISVVLIVNWIIIIGINWVPILDAIR